MVEMTKMEGMQLGKERLAGELETLTRMDDTEVDYTKLGTMDPAVFDERHHLAGLVRDINYVTALRLGIFEIDLPQRLTRGFVGPPH